MKHSPLRHVVLRSLLGSLLLACSVHAATTPAEFATLRTKAQTGNAVAQYNLGLAYADLHESFYDPVEAYVWLNLAASNGTTGKALAAITDTMTPVQLQEGQRRFAARRAAVPSSPVAATQANPASAPSDAASAAASKESAQPASPLNAQLADANKRLAIAQAALVSKEKAIAALQSQLASAPTPAPAPVPAADTAVLSSLSEKLTQTTDALVAARRAQSLAEAEASSLKANADKVSAERLAIAAQLENATAETARLRAELEAAQLSAPAVTELREKFKAAAKTLADTQAERDALARQLADAKTPSATPAAAGSVAPDSSDLSERLAATEKARSEAQSNLNAALRTYTLNQAEIERLQKSLAIIEGERAAAVAKLAVANKELVTLRPQADTASASASQAMTLRTQLAEAQRTAADRADAIDRSAQDLATARQTAAGAANELAVVREQLRLTQAQSASCANEVLELKTRLALGGVAPTAPSRPGSNSLFPGSVAVTSPVISLPVATPADGPAAKPEVAPPSDARTHVVASGDSLSSIAKRYYGNANRWNDILEANRGTLRNANTLTLGTKLRIP